MMRRILIASLLAAAVEVAAADEYWIAYEGNDLPEDVGWKRVWGNRDGPFKGEGARRSIEDGLLVMDSLDDYSVWDVARLERPGQIDPEFAELFVMEWRLLVDEVIGRRDPGVVIASDHGNLAAFVYSEDHLIDLINGFEIPFEPGQWHTYLLRSADMIDYELYLDEQLVLRGPFLLESTIESRVSFGDMIEGSASLARWDYLRFGVVPEPSALLLAACAALRFLFYTGKQKEVWK